MKRRAPVVVDTNVLMVADGRHEGASLTCEVACGRRLAEVMATGRVVVDDGYRILREYNAQFRERTRAPGAGEQFLMWLLTNQGNSECFERVSIRGEGSTFAEYPSHPELAQFDPSDRKFIAVAAAHPERPPVLQALDSKWWGLRATFEDAGLAIVFLCEDEIAASYAKKFP